METTTEPKYLCNHCNHKCNYISGWNKYCNTELHKT